MDASLNEDAMKPKQVEPKHRLYRAAGLTIATLCLSACQTTHESASWQKPHVDTAPESWAASANESQPPSAEPEAHSAANDQSAWWQLFKDPTLDALIQQASAQNTDLQTSLSNIRQARAARGLEATDQLPSIHGSVAASDSHTRNRETGTHSSSQNFNAGIDASWEIDLFGQQRKAIEAADAKLAASYEDYYNVQISISAEVAQTYFSLRATEAQLALVQQTLESRTKTQQLIEWEAESGEADALDTAQGRASVEQARAQIPELEQSIEEQRNSLAILCGALPQALRRNWQHSAQFPEMPAPAIIGIPAETLQQRPDVRAAEHRIEAASAQLASTERSRLPSLNLSGSIGIEALESGDLLDPTRIISSALASLSAPIWDAGRIQRSVEQQLEAVTQSYLNYQSVLLNALAEVENALTRIDAQSRQLNTLTTASEAAQNAENLARLQYQSGEVDLLTVLETQRTALSLEQSRITAQANQLSAQVQLYKALGGGWSPVTELSQL